MSKATWHILGLGFVALILLILIHGLEGTAQTEQIYQRVTSILDTHSRSERLLNELRSDILSSSIAIRDRLLDNSPANARFYRRELLRLKVTSMDHLRQLEDSNFGLEADGLRHIKRELEGYWRAVTPLLESTAEDEPITDLRRELVGHRRMIALATRQIQNLNLAALEKERGQIEQSQAEFGAHQTTFFWSLLALGALVCSGCIVLLARLNRKVRKEGEKSRSAQQQLRALSQHMLKTHEEDRKHLSRELHDQIGQMLTGLKMEVGRLRSITLSNPAEIRDGLERVERLAADSVEAVRDLAKGLRPSVLDDLGLQAALQWQVREFTRRTAVPVALKFSEGLEDLPESHRTCTFRIVQEALTNCARHSRARNIGVVVELVDGQVTTRIVDDGVGLDDQSPDSPGLGLIGMRERAEELGGHMSVESRKGGGTRVQVTVPLPSRESGCGRDDELNRPAAPAPAL